MYMKRYLIVIDVQKDFVDGALGTAEAVAIIPRVKEKIAEYKKRGDEIIYTRDTHGESYLATNEGRHLPLVHCIKGTDGWQLYDGIYNEGSRVIDKPSFGFNGWSSYITEEDASIEIIGLCTDICVVSNALILKALFPNAIISVDPSACAGVTPATHEAAISTMKMCQIEMI